MTLSTTLEVSICGIAGAAVIAYTGMGTAVVMGGEEGQAVTGRTVTLDTDGMVRCFALRSAIVCIVPQAAVSGEIYMTNLTVAALNQCNGFGGGMDIIPDLRTVGRCMTVVTILASGCVIVEIGQHCVMGIAACRMEGMIKLTRDLRMAVYTGGRTACIASGAALQGSVRATGQIHIGMTVFTSDATGMNTGDNISCAVTVGTLSRT